jgi:predicted DNA binding CopG/RHH family protein
MKKSMASRTRVRYTNEPMQGRVVKDFLPSPEELVFRNDTVKVTIALSRDSVEFFKQQAARHHTPYQAMIRSLIDQYVAAFR